MQVEGWAVVASRWRWVIVGKDREWRHAGHISNHNDGEGEKAYIRLRELCLRCWLGILAEYLGVGGGWGLTIRSFVNGFF